MSEDKTVFFLMRYSVFTKGQGSWLIGRDVSHEEYKESLFNEARLDYHFRLFSKVTLPTLAKTVQKSPVEATCVILTSAEMPRHHKDNLYEAVSDYPWIEVVETTYNTYVDAAFKSAILRQLEVQGRLNCLYATVRLDDDDALRDSYLDQLVEYMIEENVGSVVSFSKGYNAYLTDGVITSLSEVNTPKNAQGLAYIAALRESDQSIKTVFSLGRHTKVDSVARLIVDEESHCYLRCVHEQSDRSLRVPSRNRVKVRELAVEEVVKHFCISREMFA